MAAPDPDAVAASIHASLPVVDGHNDLPWRLRTSVDGDLDAADPGGHLSEFHTDIPRMLAGGVGGQFWSVYVPADIEEPYRATLSQIALVESMVARDPRLEMARTADDVRRIRATGRIASLMGAEGGHSIEGSIVNLESLAERGVRYMTLTHSDTTEWADSATDEPRHGGMSDLGRHIVREMNRLGVIVDVSHVSPDTMWAALETSTAPVIASHSNARALADHPRNVPDDVLAGIGRRGGVVMAVFVSGFVVPATAAASIDMFATWRQVRARLGHDEAAIADEMERIELARDLDRGTVSDVADHIEHIAAIAGVDAAGIGSDFDGTTLTPEGLEDVSCFPAITAELLRRSWSEGDIRKLLGDNVLRVMEAAESVAGSR